MSRDSSRTRQAAIRVVERSHRAGEQPSLRDTLLRAATSRPARIAYVVVGTAGLAALAVALVGPGRINRRAVRMLAGPLRGALEPHAEKLWDDSRQLRDQIANLLKRATPSGRERLVRNFQSWIGHFRAT